MISHDLKSRTKKFALDIIQFSETLKDTRANRILVHQLLRAATSVGANCKAAYRARSKKGFIAKIGIVEEEADECMYWLELIEESNNNITRLTSPLWKEASELTAIFTTIGKTSKRNNHKKNNGK